MNIKKVGITTVMSGCLLLTNLININAENLKLQSDKQIDVKGVEKYNTINYKKIELNKTYNHEIRNEPYDKSYNDNLYIEFELKQDGYITFNKSNLYTNDGDINKDEDDYRFELGDKNYNPDYLNYIRRLFSIGNGDYSYKIGLSKGVYRIVIDPNFKVTEDSYINYSINFEPKNIVDLEPNDKQSDNISQIKFNQVYEGIFDKKRDCDIFMFNNQSKRDIEIKINFDENIKDEIYENIRQTYLVISDKNNTTIENKSLLNLSTDEDGFISFKLNRLPKGEYYFTLENGNEGKAQVEYTFELVADINFTDIENHWAQKEILDFANNKYINGYSDETFRPNNPITRAEFVTIFNNYLGLTKTSGKSFNDTQTHWAKTAIDIAVTNGVCNGYDEQTFGPDDYITREQAAKMISNYMKLDDTNHDKLGKYNDKNKVSSWALNSVEGIIEQGYMNGYSDGTFKPENPITRAEAVVTLSRISNKN